MLWTRKEIIITISPNRDDNNHGLIITMDVDSQRTNDHNGFFFDRLKNHEARRFVIIR
jgi:hypothetical protein